VQCRKCGADLHHEERICARCGTPTPRGGGFYVEEEPKWRPSPQAIKIVAGAVALLLVVVISYKLLHVTPPEVVAEKWFSSLVSRRIGNAEAVTSKACMDSLMTRMQGLRSLSDDYYTEVVNNQAKYKLSAPAYRDRNHADVRVTLSYPSGDPMKIVSLGMVKQGRRWLVDSVT
jgi:hypothetical protein